MNALIYCNCSLLQFGRDTVIATPSPSNLRLPTPPSSLALSALRNSKPPSFLNANFHSHMQQLNISSATLPKSPSSKYLKANSTSSAPFRPKERQSSSSKTPLQASDVQPKNIITKLSSNERTRRVKQNWQQKTMMRMVLQTP